ncbi:rhamnan synthesis F family protein [Microbacterium sp. USHLN272]|uniref:rhamnan synthesis F family protein n=1 Tax=Microbacterium sp. USHLN272 TaxID=3081287 RepID=UPI00301672E1
MTKRLALVAHYDPRGEAAPHVLRQLDELGTQFDEVVLATTVDLSPSAADAISSRATLIRRANYGHDFGSWRDCLERYDWAQSYDEVLLTNDSYVGFFRPLGEIMQTMSARPVELWGITQSARHSLHIQSYYLHFTREALHSLAFRRFWTDSKPAPDRQTAIQLQEVGISRAMSDAGYRFDAYFTPTRDERLRATRRGVHWLRQRRKSFPARFDTLEDGYFDARQWRDPEQADNLNWSSAFADSSLDDGRLPLIKLDTLRYDPYWLGAGTLLEELEKKYPVQMDGVREYLIATQPYYSQRRYENYGFARLNAAERLMFGYRPPQPRHLRGRASHVVDS